LDIAYELTTLHQLPIPMEVVVAEGHRVSFRFYCNLIVGIEINLLIQPPLIDELPITPHFSVALEMGN